MIIALHGEPGVGKDTIADMLATRFKFKKLAFADKLYEMLLALDPMVTADIEGLTRGRPVIRMRNLRDVVEELGWRRAKDEVPGVRRMLQRLATEVIREHIGRDFWVKEVARQAEGHPRVVITDLRFPNEFAWVESQAGVVWWVFRTQQGVAFDAKHESEQWHPVGDVSSVYSLRNDGSIDELRAKVTEMAYGTLSAASTH